MSIPKVTTAIAPALLVVLLSSSYLLLVHGFQHQHQQQHCHLYHAGRRTTTTNAGGVVSAAFVTHYQDQSSRSNNSRRRTSNNNFNRRIERRIPQLPGPTTVLQATTTFYDDFEDFDGMIGGGGSSSDGMKTSSSSNDNVNTNNNINDVDDDLYAALRRRQDSLFTTTNDNDNDNNNNVDPLKNKNMNTNSGNGAELRTSDYPSSSSASANDNSNDNKNNNSELNRLLYNWKEANCISTVRLTLSDWIRRITIDERLYPLMVCGSAGGNLYLADLEEGEELDCVESVHAAQVVISDNNDDYNNDNDDDDRNIPDALNKLFGKYDGGGVLAVAMKDDLVVSSGREGGVHVCTIVGEETEMYTGSRGGTTRQTRLRLQREGKIRGLEKYQDDNNDDVDNKYNSNSNTNTNNANTNVEDETIKTILSSSAPLVTSLAFDNQGTLWVAGYDGILRGYDHEELDADGRPLLLRQRHAEYEINVGSPIVSMSINDELGCGVLCTTGKRGVILFSLDDGQPIGRWNPCKGSKRDEFVRSALVVATGHGGNDSRGSSSFLYERLQKESEDDDDNDSQQHDLPQWTLIVGGSKGSLYQRGISVDPRTGFLNEDMPFVKVTPRKTSSSVNEFESIRIPNGNNNNIDDATNEKETTTTNNGDGRIMEITPGAPEKIRPNHLGPVVDLASPAPGLFVSGSHDGTMRVWSLGSDVHQTSTEDNGDDTKLDGGDNTLSGNVADLVKKIGDAIPTRRPKVLYALSGYKVWLGSIFANSRKLVSDGADNTIIVHSFDENEEDVIRSREEDDEDDIDEGDFAYD